MYLVRSTRDFEKSYNKLKRSGINRKVFDELEYVVSSLSIGDKLDKKYRDHQLSGNFAGYRECHIKSDLLLVYEIYDNDLILLLVNLGSHSELFK